MTDRELMQMALDALEQVQEADTAGATPKMVMEARKLYEPTITALRAALAQPEQEIETDRPHVENDGCPTENAVLQRFWRKHQAKPEQEPVMLGLNEVILNSIRDSSEVVAPPRSEPVIDKTMAIRIATQLGWEPQREWQGLTDEERDEICLGDEAVAYAIEAKLKEKNS